VSLVLIIVLACAGLAYVLLPLLHPPAGVPRSRTKLTDAERRKSFALQAILDLESDHAAGKLTEDELASLRVEHEIEAVAAMRDLDVLQADADDELETRVASERTRLE